jgi:hypothetical protein
MIFSKRRACNGRLTIGRSKEGLPLVGFKYRKADDWLDLNLKQEGVRLEGFKYQKGYDWLDLNSNQEGVRLVGFKYQKGYDWLDSQFHCSYLESRGRHFRSKLYYYYYRTSFRSVPLPVTWICHFRSKGPNRSGIAQCAWAKHTSGSGDWRHFRSGHVTSGPDPPHHPLHDPPQMITAVPIYY